MYKNLTEKFNPLVFLSALGAGGISVAAFVIIQYTLWAGEGLAVLSQVEMTTQTFILETIMIVFGLLHFVLTIFYIPAFLKWIKTDSYKEFKENPLVNAGLMTPLLSFAMTLNVVIATVRYFIDIMSSNFQTMMLPGFIGFAILWFIIVNTEINLLKKSFTKGFDMDKIHFGWLLHPFALAMITVTGAGLAALSKTIWIADVSAFMTLISGTMATFLLTVKMFSIFKKHFNQEGALSNHFMPTYIIVIPIITLLALTVFRLGHYAEHNFAMHSIMELAKVSVVVAFAFQVWYFWFGLVMLKDYWKTYFKTHYHVSQWGLICPFVAFAVIGGFVYQIFAPYLIFSIFLNIVLLIVVALYIFLLSRMYKCLSGKKEDKFICD